MPRKTTVKKKSETAIDPFASVVEAPAKRGAPVVEKAAKQEASAPKPAKRRAAPKKIVTAADPFTDAVPVSDAAPTAEKKRAPKKVKAAAASPAKKVRKKPAADIPAAVPEVSADAVLSPAFVTLRDVSLPELKRENRARLAMQSPTRLYFYWSLSDDPWHRLRSIFGTDLGSYTLVVKLCDLTRDTEEIHACDAEGNWWFAVEPDTTYRAEIGFYAVNRPYFRVLYSNMVTTPRRSPSPHPAAESQWMVSAAKFAEVLDNSGFSRDAVDVALAGDDPRGAREATFAAFSGLVGTRAVATGAPEDMRFALLALASGSSLDELRSEISPAVLAALEANAGNIGPDAARAALDEYFDAGEGEWQTDDASPAVYGSSLVHFPRTLRSRRPGKGYRPVGSHDAGRF